MLGKEVTRPQLCFELLQGKRGFWKYKVCFRRTSGWGVRCRSCTVVRTPLAPRGQHLTGPLTPICALAVGCVGRQQVCKQNGKNRVFIHGHVYEEGKNCVNCMMKLKPLMLNEKYESGPKLAEGLRVPGVCRKQPESGAEVESRAVSGLVGPISTRVRRRQGARLTCLSEG